MSRNDDLFKEHGIIIYQHIKNGSFFKNQVIISSSDYQLHLNFNQNVPGVFLNWFEMRGTEKTLTRQFVFINAIL